MNISKKEIEKCRKSWSKIAKKYGWYIEPFYIILWVTKDGAINDSLATREPRTSDLIHHSESDCEVTDYTLID